MNRVEPQREEEDEPEQWRISLIDPVDVRAEVQSPFVTVMDIPLPLRTAMLSHLRRVQSVNPLATEALAIAEAKVTQQQHTLSQAIEAFQDCPDTIACLERQLYELAHGRIPESTRYHDIMFMTFHNFVRNEVEGGHAGIFQKVCATQQRMLRATGLWIRTGDTMHKYHECTGAFGETWVQEGLQWDVQAQWRRQAQRDGITQRIQCADPLEDDKQIGALLRKHFPKHPVVKVFEPELRANNHIPWAHERRRASIERRSKMALFNKRSA